jgi:hypothetical protein
MQIIPIQAVPSQAITVSLGDQNCQISIYQKQTGLFIDLYVNNTLLLAGVICENLNRIVRSAHFGFTGDLVFSDQHGTSDPVYTGLGTRYLLCYLEAADLTAAVLAA